MCSEHLRERPATKGRRRNAPLRSGSQHVFRQPRIGETGENGRQRCLHAAHREAPLGAEPSFIARMRGAGIPHHSLYMARQIVRGQLTLDLKQRMIGDAPRR